jgi:hypothetical protein
MIAQDDKQKIRDHVFMRLAAVDPGVRERLKPKFVREGIRIAKRLAQIRLKAMG